MKKLSRLEALFSVILEEARANPSFCHRLEGALNGSGHPPAPQLRVSNRRQKATIDPFILLESGEGHLREALANLGVEQLKDIIAEYGMDRSKLALKWKKSQRLVELIVDTARSRARKGEAFRSSPPATSELHHRSEDSDSAVPQAGPGQAPTLPAADTADSVISTSSMEEQDTEAASRPPGVTTITASSKARSGSGARVSSPVICYLCGEEIRQDVREGGPDALSRDHVPPEQFYPSEFVRTNQVKNLLTLPSHRACNCRYSKDEEYFVTAIGSLASESYAGSVLWEDIKRKAKKPRRGLLHLVRQEFMERSPGGIDLPPGKVLKSFDAKRVGNVIWKITRGLFFNDFKRFLPEGTHHRLFLPGNDPEGHEHVLITPSRGLYPGVFDYKYVSTSERGMAAHWWAFLFWDQFIAHAIFPDPETPEALGQDTLPSR